MLARLAAAAALIALASCAGLEPAGRNAGRAPTPVASRPAPPPPTAATTLPAPAPATPAPAPVVTQRAPPPPAAAPVTTARVEAPPPAPVAAPAVRVPTPPPEQPAQRASADGDIVVPGQVQSQVPPPMGDPRSTSERMEDVRAWDQCITQVQSAFERDPMRPQLDSPEDYCRRSLGMRDRTSVPESRRIRR